MTQQEMPNKAMPSDSDSRGLSQAIFVAAALAIITGGVWSLYMSNAPYHPDDTQIESQLQLGTGDIMTD